MERYDRIKIIVVIMAMMIAQQAWPYRMKGRIMTGKTPLPEIGVKISDKDGRTLGQSYTDNRGLFLIDSINTEKVVVEVNGERYVPLRFEVVTGNADTDLGTLSLEKITDLGEVTVTGKGKVNIPGKTIVYVSGVEKERAAGAFNMLTILAYKAPQIRVRESERTLTIEGEEPQVLVNGIKRPMSFISSIKPDAIERIEFSTVPDVRFGKRYLNIITRRMPDGGWLMADVAGAITTPRNFFSGVAEYTKGKNDFMLYYNGGYRHGRREYIDETERYIGGGNDITLGVEGKPSSTLDKYHNLNFYFTRVPSEKSMFVATGALSIHENDREINGLVIELTRIYDRANNRGYRYILPSLSLYYNLKASETAAIEVDAVGSYTDHTAHRDLSYSTGYESRLSTTSPTWYFSTEAIWKQKLPFARLNTGIGVSYSDATNEYTIDGVTSRQSLSGTRMNAYTSMSGSVLTVGYRLSAGVAYYKVEREMASPDLTASLQKSIGDNLSVAYNFRYNSGMPPLSSYNDVATPVNELMYHIGSDKIKAQRNLSNQIQVQFGKEKFYMSLQSSVNRVSRPFVTDYRYEDDPDRPFHGFFLETPGNGRSQLSYGFDCNAGVNNLWNFLSFSASTGWGHNRLKAGETFTECSWYLNLNMGLYWKGWQVNMAAENLVPSWSMWGGSKSRRWPYTSLAVYKKFGNWDLHASWNNLFSRYGGRYRTEALTTVAPRTSDYRMNDQGNLVEIGVRYQFTTGRLLNKKRRSINLSGKGDNGVRWDY